MAVSPDEARTVASLTTIDDPMTSRYFNSVRPSTRRLIYPLTMTDLVSGTIRGVCASC